MLSVGMTMTLWLDGKEVCKDYGLARTLTLLTWKSALGRGAVTAATAVLSGRTLLPSFVLSAVITRSRTRSSWKLRDLVDAFAVIVERGG